MKTDYLCDLLKENPVEQIVVFEIASISTPEYPSELLKGG